VTWRNLERRFRDGRERRLEEVLPGNDSHGNNSIYSFSERLIMFGDGGLGISLRRHANAGGTPKERSPLDGKEDQSQDRSLGAGRRGRVLCDGQVTYGASNHGISGTVYSGCSGQGPWFVSSTARTKAGTGAIKAIFTDINDGGLTFKLLDRNNIWRTFASNVSNGTR
jgi:hypothetical protein